MIMGLWNVTIAGFNPWSSTVPLSSKTGTPPAFDTSPDEISDFRGLARGEHQQIRIACFGRKRDGLGIFAVLGAISFEGLPDHDVAFCLICFRCPFGFSPDQVRRIEIASAAGSSGLKNSPGGKSINPHGSEVSLI